jgi:phosphomannomutase
LKREDRIPCRFQLLLLEIVSKSGKKVSELFEPFFKKHFVSDELNFPLESVKQSDLVLKKIEYAYPDAVFRYVDGKADSSSITVKK